MIICIYKVVHFLIVKMNRLNADLMKYAYHVQIRLLINRYEYRA